MKRITLLFTLLAGIGLLNAQHEHKCGTDLFTEGLIQADPVYYQKYIQAQELLHEMAEVQAKEKTQGIIYTIPVVVHIIYNDYRDNISRAQIEDGLRVLNEDFRRLNADASNTRSIFQSSAADVEIQFALAKVDEDGNCTDGITRTQSTLSIDASDNVKPLINWDNSKYFNIWVVNSIANNSTTNGTILGYAYFPVFGNQNYQKDGMVIRHDQIGIIGTAITSSVSNANNQKGRTITHEAGHYLGLAHTFSQGCFGGGDGVSDTPPVSVANDGCDFNTNTCSNDNPDLPDMIENYMDYSNGSCQNMFTNGQTAIMRSTLLNSNLRQNLRNTTNLTSTGVTNPPDCKPVAQIALSDQIICPGETIDFFDASEDGDPSSWSWSFAGGTPNQSTQKDVTVTYNTPGVYDVKLIVSNTAGGDSIVYSQHISVKTPGNPAIYPNWNEDFETSSISPDVTLIDAGDGIGFELFTQAGSSGSQSIKLDNFSSTIDGEIDYVISPAISTIFTQNLSLSFDHAFAAKDNTNTDELNVYASIDCGETWILRRFYRGSQLRTAPNNTQAFTPTSSEWATKTISFDAYIGPDPLLIKFEFVNGEGNNLFLDNIGFSGTIGLDEYVSDQVQLFPNPAESYFTLSSESYHIDGSEITINDVSGKILMQKTISSNTQNVRVNLEDYNLKSGVYMITLENKDQKAVKRLIIE